MSYENRWSQHELARRAGVHQTTISRVERGALANISRPTALALMRAYKFDQDEEAVWMQTLFNMSLSNRDLTQILNPHLIENQFEFHLRHGIRQHPQITAQFGNLFGKLLEEFSRGVVSKVDQATYRHLSKKARLIEAWGRSMTASVSDMWIHRDAIQSIVESQKDDLYPFARDLAITIETVMVGETVCDPEEIASMIPRSRNGDPFVTAMLFQELTTQYIHSPMHGMYHIKQAVQEGKLFCSREPSLHTQMNRLNLLYAVGVFLKTNDPSTGAELMRDVIAQLRVPELYNPFDLLEASGFAAMMLLHVDMSSQQAATMLSEAYQRAGQIGAVHLSEWITGIAATYGVSLQIEDSTVV